MSVFDRYFDKVYCINLDKRSDRWGKVSKIFVDNNIDGVERYSAVDGNSLNVDNITYNKSLLKGELGILETHIKLIKEAKEQKLKSILIMEDDVYFTKEIEKFDDYMSHVPNNWDMLFVGGNHLYGETPIKINEKIMKLNNTVAIHCLGVKDTLFDVILEVTKRRMKQIDAYYADLQKGYNAYSFTPNMALQYEDFSDIQNRNVNYDSFLKY
jgi:GR25 family glycosyltransferase involved in LPS biosynthesis